MLRRRDFLKATAGTALVAAVPGCGRKEKRWSKAAFQKTARSRVAIVPADRYGERLHEIVLAGLRLFSLNVTGRRVVLKPNLVEFDPKGLVNTHPTVLAAVIEGFRRLGARQVVVGEGAANRRDTEFLLSASGIGEVLAALRVPFVDLNNDAVRRVRLRSDYSGLGELYLPETVLGADLLVSLPKMKTHHWAGVTLSMKNLFGIVPGSIYGWPKNLLHWAGIDGSILDLCASLEVPRFNIVDGIIGMEGNGPIQGDPVPSGVVVMGADALAVDTTCTRLMRIDPSKIRYLEQADAFLGNAGGAAIDQMGEPIERFQRDYRVIDSFQHIKTT